MARIDRKQIFGQIVIKPASRAGSGRAKPPASRYNAGPTPAAKRLSTPIRPGP
jgi:hypothetical protein